jgi:hypothetical protein
MLVFIHMNKTGGTTVTYILRSSYGLRHCQVEPWTALWTDWNDPPFSSHDLQRLRRFYPNLKSIAGHRVFGHVDLQEKGTEFQYFTLMRNPLKSCASRFQYKVQVSRKKNLVFEEWIQRDWTHNHQTKWIAGVEDVNEAIRTIREKNIFVGIAEHFDESMVLLKQRLANDLNISYRRVNVAPDNTIKDHLLSTDSTRQMLVEAQQADLELYGFVKQELFPTYRREYGPTFEADVAQYRETQSHSFNYRNLTLSRLKHYMLYKPLLYLNRKGVRFAWLDRETRVPVGVDG